MRTIVFSLLSFLILSISTNIAAKEKFEKKVNKEFETSPTDSFSITHKYGNIKIENWEENRISIEAIIIAEAKNAKEAAEKFDIVEIHMSKKNNVVLVETHYKKGQLNNLKVDYNIKMPRYLSTMLNCKFGSAYINELTRLSDISVSYGNLEIKNLRFVNSKPLSKVTLAYSNGTIGEANYLNLEVKYGNLELKKSTALQLTSRFSNIEIGEMHTLVLDSKYDNIELTQLHNLFIESKFTNVEIGLVENKIDATLGYGNFEVDHMNRDFESISIINKYASIEIGLDGDASYSLDAEIDNCQLDLAGESDLSITKDGTEKTYKGFVGRDKSSKAYIKIKSKYGDIDLH